MREASIIGGPCFFLVELGFLFGKSVSDWTILYPLRFIT